MCFPVFGAAPRGADLAALRRSPHYRNGAFQNLEPTPVMLPGTSYWRLLAELRNRPADRTPRHPLPSLHPVLDAPAPPAGTLAFTWFGHSSLYLEAGATRILVDPVFNGYAAPFPVLGKAFPGTDVVQAGQFPPLDWVILTHDHYDHLDYRTIVQLAPRTRRFVVPLGVDAHLRRWGVPPGKLVPLDWWAAWDEPGTARITATPARHFSGRLFRRNQTLWTAYVLDLAGYRLYLGGDSGYDATFRTVGERFGPFDLAFVECGQYGTYWPYIHMLPEQTAQAARGLQARCLVPVHWGKFALANHSWDEPVRRVAAAAERLGVPLCTPRIGERVVPSRHLPQDAWWDAR